ncbi:MAG: phosphate ABC transporter permease subunit PstC [Cellvibrionaceae bacterium]|nr:phosphate ABC transporter permease subunit PstC [Cellvibrionaceae bacterium]
MESSVLLPVLALLCALAFVAGRSRSLAVAGVGGMRILNSLPFYYGSLTAFWCALPSLAVVLIWSIFDGVIIENMVHALVPPAAVEAAGGNIGLVMNQVRNLAAGHLSADSVEPAIAAAADRLVALERINRWALTGVALSFALIGAILAWLKINPQLRARAKVEDIFRWTLLACASLAILTTIGIVMSVLFESMRFFSKVPVTEFLFGLEWSPQTAIRADQQGSSGSFGAVPLFAGTLLIAGIALLVAVPTGLMVAIYLTEYASPRMRNLIKPVLEILAGIPTVVYGFFAALTVAPVIRDMGVNLGLDEWLTISSESALAAGLVMGVMIIPFVSSLSDDVITAVPRSLKDGALGLGSTRSEVVKLVVIPAALPGIVGSVLLAASRAIGETMIVVMAAGLAANLTANPFDSVTTVTVQIVTLLVGDQEFESAKTLAAFALGLVLFVVTLGLNYFALYIVRKYREQYE